MKRVYLLALTLIFVLHHISSVGQSPQLEWAKSMGSSTNSGSFTDLAYGVTTDLAGNVYTTGHFIGAADFDPGINSTILDSGDYRHIFVQKLDKDGNFLWAVSMGGSQALTYANTHNAGYAITTDIDGNVYVTGYFMGTADFDPGPNVANLTAQSPSGQNSLDIFVLKLDTDGNYVWAKSMGGWFFESGRAISLDLAGNIYITGQFRVTVDFDPGPGTANLSADHPGQFQSLDDAFLVKLDNDGNYQWATSLGSDGYDGGFGVTNDKSGNVYTTGFYTGTVDFDPGPDSMFLSSNSARDIFVQKLDTDGNFLWAKSIGGGQYGPDEAYAITLDKSENVYLTGFFNYEIDADPGPDTTIITGDGYRNPFVIKLDSEGDFIWGKSINGTANNNRGQSIIIDVEDNVYTVGEFEGIADFDPGLDSFFLTGENGKNTFIQKLDMDGNFVWAGCIGGEAQSISADTSCNIFVTGGFVSTVDFDPGTGTTYLMENGSTEIYVTKFFGGCDVVNPCAEITTTDSLSFSFDDNLFVDAVGFANNPNIVFTNPGTPADAILSDVSLELFVRLNGSSCENEIAVQITDPAGNTQSLTAFTTCNGGNGLLYTEIPIPNVSTTGSTANWLIEFDDTNNQNTDYEYSVRFARLNYASTVVSSALSSAISVNNQPISNGLYQAADEVNSTGTVPNNGTVNFKAGQIILLDNGFSVAPNADFSAEIEECTGN